MKIIAIDFDKTVVVQDGRDYEDVTTPLQFLPGAHAGLLSLKAAGHVLLLYSARANRALRVDPNLDPLVRAGVKRVNLAWWTQSRTINEARYQQMVEFAAAELPGVFDAIDDGLQGKPSADLYLDDKALGLGQGAYAVDWAEVVQLYGDLRTLRGGRNVKNA